MSAAVKYTLARFGLFVAVFLALLPVPMNLLVKAMLALIASAAFSFLLLRRWRDDMAEQLAAMARRRGQEKERLRAALAGDESAAAAGDRVSDVAAESGEAGPEDRAGR
jgi:flagellar biosynthesis/type III secretory pathway M-ring protein FliF/YscJ